MPVPLAAMPLNLQLIFLCSDSSSPHWVLQTPSTSTYPELRTGVQRRYTPEQLQSAVKAVYEGSLTTKQASILYHVPKSTIWHRLYVSRPSTSTSAAPSTKGRKSPYSLRHSSGFADSDSSRSPRNSPYFFRRQPSSKQSPRASSSAKPSLAKGKSATTPQVIEDRSALDTR